MAGIAATYFTSKAGREAQADSEERNQQENRHSDLTARRQVTYSAFVAAVWVMNTLTTAQGAIDDAIDKVEPPDPALLDEAIMEYAALASQAGLDMEKLAGAVAKERREALQTQSVYDFRGWVDRMSTALALYQQVVLIADEDVKSAARAVIKALPATIVKPGDRTDDGVRRVESLPDAIAGLSEAMAAELRA